jgi:hypothetical protein
LAILDQPFNALQRAGTDAHARARFNGGRHPDFETRFYRPKDFEELPGKGGLIEDFQQVGDMIILADDGDFRRAELEKDVAGKERFLELDGFAAVFVRGQIARKGGGDALSLAEIHEFFLPTRLGMGHEPKLF